MSLTSDDKIYIQNQIVPLKTELAQLKADNHKTHILLEDMQSNLIKALGEGYNSLYTKTEKLEKRVDKLVQKQDR